MQMRYDDEFDWHGEYDHTAARRAFWTVVATTGALMLGALAILWPFG